MGWLVPTTICLGSGPNAAPVVSWHTCRKRAVTYPWWGAGVSSFLPMMVASLVSSRNDQMYGSNHYKLGWWRWCNARNDMNRPPGVPWCPILFQHPTSVSEPQAYPEWSAEPKEWTPAIFRTPGWAWQASWSTFSGNMWKLISQPPLWQGLCEFWGMINPCFFLCFLDTWVKCHWLILA